ncbi:MAG: hypothetical protein P4L98_15415 [Ancalomicrobiaceae bacterium]|nr:hypothetical protein [Ancalomicrobiaceae bacterium]
MLVVADAAFEDMGALLAPSVLADANINPATRLATDYLNHFNNVVMLLDLISSMPECAEEVLGWQPLDYVAYFAHSHFRHRDLAVLAYREAEPGLRGRFEAMVTDLNAAMLTAQDMLRGHDPLDPETDFHLRELVERQLKPLIAETGGLINGTINVVPANHAMPDTAQESIDELFE